MTGDQLSAPTALYVVPPVKLSTIGSRVTAGAACHFWNGHPNDLTFTDSPFIFWRLLKCFLFYFTNPLLTLVIDSSAEFSCSGYVTQATLKFFYTYF